MGDVADYDIETGMDMWMAHESGNCFEDCWYCEAGRLDQSDKQGSDGCNS